MTNVVQWPLHLRARHKEGESCPENEGRSCYTCGLFICDRCKCGEGSLPTDCPGQPVSGKDQGPHLQRAAELRSWSWVGPAG